MPYLDHEAIAGLYRSNPTIALVGASSSPERDAYDVMEYLLEQGFKVIPVNPAETEVHGRPAYASLEEVPDRVDVVLVFRSSEHAAALAASAVAIGAKVLWLTLGVSSEEAAAVAEDAGLGYVEDRCIKATHKLMKRGEAL